MKKNLVIGLSIFAMVLTGLCQPLTSKAQDSKDKDKLSDSKKELNESKEAKAAFIKTDASMAKLFDNSYGYVIFPNIGKGAVGVGGAGGNGTVYEKGKAIGTATMVQVTVGAQVGGQSYREVIFFENKAALDRFKENKLEFSGQASAVAAKSGASADVKYRDGVSVFTEEIGGLMLEASIGGQKFTYKPM